MRIDRSFRPWLCCGPESGHPWVGGGRLFASDGCVLVALPLVMEEGDVGGWLSGDVLRYAVSRTSWRDGEVRLVLGSERVEVVADGSLHRRVPPCWAPPLGGGEMYVRVVESAMRCLVEPLGGPVVSFDVGLVSRVARAIGVSSVVFRLAAAVDPILLRPWGVGGLGWEVGEDGFPPGPFGLVMPLRVLV